MAEEMEKVYCMQHDNTPLLAELINAKSQGVDAAEMAALFSNNNGWQNNPFMYLIWLAFLGNGGFGFGGNNAQSSEIMGRLNSLERQAQDNHNNGIALQAIQGNHNAIHELANTLGSSYRDMALAVSNVQNAITQVGGQVGMTGERVINAANLGDLNIVQQLKDCCCNTQKAILTQGYENQLANERQTNTLQSSITETRQALVNGFANIGYDSQRQTCDIINAGNANTQRIIDTLNCHWNADLQQRYNDVRLEMSQLKQNETLIAALKTT